MPLTSKQDRFVTQYLLDNNGSAAAVRAGYAAGSARQAAHRLLTNDYIAAALAERTMAVAERASLDVDWLIAGLRAITDAPDTRPADQIAAYREIGKLLGFYVDRSVNVSTFVRPELAGIPPDKLAIMQEIAYPGSTGKPAIEAAVSRLLPAIDGEGRVLDEGAAG